MLFSRYNDSYMLGSQVLQLSQGNQYSETIQSWQYVFFASQGEKIVYMKPCIVILDNVGDELRAMQSTNQRDVTLGR